jgi:hypothetical protein
VPRTLRSMKCCAAEQQLGPGSAEQRYTLHRVRDTRAENF